MISARTVMLFKTIRTSFDLQKKNETGSEPQINLYDASSFEPRHEKTNVLVSDLVRHKPGCTATEDG